MNIENRLRELVNQLFINTGASFSGIFIEGKDVISKTIYPAKRKNLQEIMNLIINKAHQINEFIPEFGEEYVYAEGPDISIFIYFVRPDIAIGSIIEEKPKFALLKFEHSVLSNKLKEMQDDLDKYIEGIQIEEETKEETTEEVIQEIPEESQEELLREYPEEQPEYEEIQLESLEHVIPELKETKKEEEQSPPEEEKSEITVEDVKDRFVEELEMLEKTKELEEFEEKPSSEEKIQPEEELTLEENPPLEEILKTPEEEKPHTIDEEIEKVSEEQEFYDPDVLTKIREELLKEIGPVGKFLFKRKIKKLDIDENKITRNTLIKLIDELSDDIIDEKRKKRFIDRVSTFL
ncbi:hypothetical protein [Persephonella sp.]